LTPDLPRKSSPMFITHSVSFYKLWWQKSIVEQFITFYKNTFQTWFFSIDILGTAYNEESEWFLFTLLLSRFLKESVRIIF
jgi:uncharacterized membrane protein YpjA